MGSKVQANPYLISNALEHSTILMRLGGMSRDEILRELVGCFPCEHSELRDQLFDALLTREKLCSTALDGGIAIPHSRAAIAGLVQKPVIVFARHLIGVDFGAPDKQPTQLFFLLCADGIQPHLQMLSRLSRLMRNTLLREQLLRAPTTADVLDALRAEEARLGS